MDEYEDLIAVIVPLLERGAPTSDIERRVDEFFRDDCALPPQPGTSDFVQAAVRSWREAH